MSFAEGAAFVVEDGAPPHGSSSCIRLADDFVVAELDSGGVAGVPHGVRPVDTLLVTVFARGVDFIGRRGIVTLPVFEAMSFFASFGAGAGEGAAAGVVSAAGEGETSTAGGGAGAGVGSATGWGTGTASPVGTVSFDTGGAFAHAKAVEARRTERATSVRMGTPQCSARASVRIAQLLGIVR